MWLIIWIRRAWARTILRLYEAIFDLSRQAKILILGLFVFVVGASLMYIPLRPLNTPFFTANPEFFTYITILGTFSLGLSGSIVAAALIVKMLSEKNTELAQLLGSGIYFLGPSDDYPDWDEWVLSTPSDGKLVICGEGNRGWVEKSIFPILTVADRGAEVIFIFLGKQDDAKKNYKELVEDRDYPQFREGVKKDNNNIGCFWYSPYKSEDEDKADREQDLIEKVGFYWNGRDLMVKTYLPNIANSRCPIIGFKCRGTSHDFKLKDFHTSELLNLDYPEALRAAAHSFSNILRDKKPLGSVDCCELSQSNDSVPAEQKTDIVWSL